MLCALVSRRICALNRPLSRYSSTSSSSNFHPSAKLVAELRKKTTASIQKSREALLATDGDLTAAIEWLEKDQAITGRQKVEKLVTRTTGEGLVGMSVLSSGSKGGDAPSGVRAAIVELNCETDFVGRNELFQNLTKDLAFTAALLSSPPSVPGEDSYTDTNFIVPLDLTSFQDAPLVIRDQPNTDKPIKVSDAVRNLITAVGENITIRRVASFVHQSIPTTTGVGLRLAHYVHGALSSSISQEFQPVMEAQGRIGAFAALGIVTTPVQRLKELLDNPNFEKDLSTLERAVARQIVGMNPGSLQDFLNQPFDMLVGSNGQTVKTVLKNWTSKCQMVESPDMNAIEPAQILRWEVGEALKS